MMDFDYPIIEKISSDNKFQLTQSKVNNECDLLFILKYQTTHTLA